MSSLYLPNKYDCHIHSHYSHDSNLSCDKILSIAKERNLELIAVTDHNTIKGGIKTRALAKDLNLDIKVLVGAEIRTPSGEVIGLNLNKEIESRNLISVIKEIKQQDGKVVIPHPARWNKKKLPLEKIRDYIDYIEVYNGRNLLNISNLKARTMASKINIKTIVGSDAHFGFEIGNTKNSSINWKGLVGFFMTAGLKIFHFINSAKRSTSIRG